MIWFTRDIEIRYADTDQMGIVHHAVHPVYCELSRLYVCEQLGKPYPEIERDGYFLMVSEMKFRFLAPIRLTDPVVVAGCLLRVNKRLIEFGYELRHRDTQTLFCSGSTLHVVTKGVAGAASLPDEILSKLKAGLE